MSNPSRRRSKGGANPVNPSEGRDSNTAARFVRECVCSDVVVVVMLDVVVVVVVVISTLATTAAAVILLVCMYI